MIHCCWIDSRPQTHLKRFSSQVIKFSSMIWMQLLVYALDNHNTVCLLSFAGHIIKYVYPMIFHHWARYPLKYAKSTVWHWVESWWILSSLVGTSVLEGTWFILMSFINRCASLNGSPSMLCYRYTVCLISTHTSHRWFVRAGECTMWWQ